MAYLKSVLASALLLFITVAFSAPVFAVDGVGYVTPDGWSRSITANAVKINSDGISFEDGSVLTMGLTTRLLLKTGEATAFSGFEYVRARYAGMKLGEMTISANLYMRFAYDSYRHYNNPREYYIFYSMLDAARKETSFEYRLYNGDILIENIGLPNLNVNLGRIYLNSMVNSKIDGANIAYTILDMVKLNAYYGSTVSYYTSPNSALGGITADAKIDKTGTRVRVAANYLKYYESNSPNLDAFFGKARIDQKIDVKDIIQTDLYLEGQMIINSLIYDIGGTVYIPYSKTEVTGYVSGKYDYNNAPVNNTVSIYEQILGRESEYIMGGVSVYQAVIDTIMVGLGYEARFNFNETYADRDYYRLFANLDLAGLLHERNFISIIADYYTVPAYKSHDYEDKLLVGLKVQQAVTDIIDIYGGLNVQNYQFKNNPIKFNPLSVDYPVDFIQRVMTSNNVLFYLGASYQITKNMMVQLDYSFELEDMKAKHDKAAFTHNPGIYQGHYVEFWFNYIW